LENSDILLLNGNYSISLYVHIPFCRSKCYYCDFFSVPVLKTTPVNGIVKGILNQFAHYISALPDVEIETIYIGGGTPSMLGPYLLKVLFSGIKSIYLRYHSTWNIKEWTVEANPESITGEFIEICKEYGITRISVGIQSLHDDYLKILGRPGTSYDTFKALDLLGAHWNGDINYDILSGIPGTSEKHKHKLQEKHLLNDIDLLLKGSPEHISLYSLTLEENTEMYRFVREGSYIAMDSRMEEDIWIKAASLLEAGGYDNYEISNFAGPGKECIHNLRYWHMEPYLGLGPSAVSTMPYIKKTELDRNSPGVIRITGKADIHQYLTDMSGENNPFLNAETEIISPADFLFENIMMGFRLKAGILKDKFIKRFGKGLDEIFPGLIKQWKSEGIMKTGKNNYSLTKRGRFILNTLLLSIQKHMELPSLKQIQVRWPPDKAQEK